MLRVYPGDHGRSFFFQCRPPKLLTRRISQLLYIGRFKKFRVASGLSEIKKCFSGPAPFDRGWDEGGGCVGVRSRPSCLPCPVRILPDELALPDNEPFRYSVFRRGGGGGKWVRCPCPTPAARTTLPFFNKRNRLHFSCAHRGAQRKVVGKESARFQTQEMTRRKN